MKLKGFLGLIASFVLNLSFAVEFKPQKSWPARDAFETAISRFEILNEYIPELIGWVLYTPQALNENQVAGIPVSYLKLLQTKTQEKKSKLIFSSEIKNPGSFLIDGQVRIAKTGSQFFSDIWINEDLITRLDDLDERTPLSFESIAAVLIHEYAHHLDETGLKYAHEQLDQLGAVLRKIFETRAKTFEMGKNPPFLVEGLSRPLEFSIFSSLESRFDYGNYLFLLNDSENIWDLRPFWGKTRLGPDFRHGNGSCFEISPSAELMALRQLKEEGSSFKFLFQVARMFFCMGDADPIELNLDFSLNFTQKSAGKLVFDSLKYPE